MEHASCEPLEGFPGVVKVPEGSVPGWTGRVTVTAATEGLKEFPLDGTGMFRALALVCSGQHGVQVGIMSDYLGHRREIMEYFRYGDAVSVHVVLPAEGKNDTQDLYERARWLRYHSPWADEDFWRDNPMRWIEHLPRPSAAKPGLLSYYDSPAKRAQGRLTMTKPGRYLRKFFSDLLSESEIEKLAHKWTADTAPETLHITQDADEIEAAYRNAHLGSCMHFGSGSFSGPEHPCRVYAGPDLAVAYIGDLDSPRGRCVVWPEKKIYLRLYGDVHRLSFALEAHGFRKGEESEFEGARLQRIWCDDNDLYVMPYLDAIGAASDAGDYLVIDSDGEVNGRMTNGLSDEEDRTCCDDCGDRYDPDYGGAYVEGHGYVCDSCLNSDYFYCDEINEYCRDSERADTRDPDLCVSEHGVENSSRWFLCEGYDQWVRFRDDDAYTLQDGRTVCLAWIDAGNARRCEYSEDYIATEDGTWIDLGYDGWVDADQFHSAEDLFEWLRDNGHDFDSLSGDEDTLSALKALYDTAAAEDEAELEGAAA